jgi:hypothetical protein
MIAPPTRIATENTAIQLQRRAFVTMRPVLIAAAAQNALKHELWVGQDKTPQSWAERRAIHLRDLNI